MNVDLLANFRNILDDIPIDAEEIFVRWRSCGNAYVLSGERQSIEAAARYCSGYLETLSEPSLGCAKICCLTDDGRVAAMFDSMSHEAVEIEGTSFSHLSFSVGADVLCVRYEQSRFYDLTLFSPEMVSVVAACTNGPPPFLALVRTLRNHVACRRLENGELFLHGAAVKTESGGILLLGDRRAGKTTQLCELLTQHSAKFISNDRVFLSSDSQISGVPVSVNLRQPTIDHFRQFDLNCEKGEVHAVGTVRARGDVSLSVPDFVERLRCRIVSHSHLRTIVVLTHNPEGKGVHIEQLDRKDLEDLVLAQQFLLVDKTQPFWKVPADRSHKLPELNGVNGWRICSGNQTIPETGALIASLRPSVHDKVAGMEVV